MAYFRGFYLCKNVKKSLNFIAYDPYMTRICPKIIDGSAPFAVLQTHSVYTLSLQFPDRCDLVFSFSWLRQAFFLPTLL